LSGEIFYAIPKSLERICRRPVHHVYRKSRGTFGPEEALLQQSPMQMGAGFCGLPATLKPVFTRVMDLYRHHAGFIRENWVPTMMPHWFGPMGLDPLGKLQEL
jgi:hypothetical protein